VKDGSNHPQAIPDIHVVHEDDFELAGNKKHHKKFHLSYTDFQQMEERDTPTEFAITCVRRWAQPLRFQPSITAKICSPVAKAKNKKGSNKAQFSQPGVKERDWKFHVLFLCGDAASQKEIKSSSNSGRFLSKAKSFYRHQFNIGERETGLGTSFLSWQLSSLVPSYLEVQRRKEDRVPTSWISIFNVTLAKTLQ